MDDTRKAIRKILTEGSVTEYQPHTNGGVRTEHPGFQAWADEVEGLFMKKVGIGWADISGERYRLLAAFKTGIKPLEFILQTMDKYNLDDITGLYMSY